jgi:hypothetical protein
MRGRSPLAVAALAAGLAAAAATVCAAGVSAPVMQPLSVGARSFGLAGAAVALTLDADAALVNPARLAFLRAPSVAAGYGRLVEGIPSDRGQLAAALPLGEDIAAPFQKEGAHRWSVGVALDYQRLELAQGTDYGEATATLAGALAPVNILAIGAAVRGLRTNSDVDGLGATGVALDLGFSMAVAPFLELGAAAHNVAGEVKYEDSDAETPGFSADFAMALTRWRWLAAEAGYTMAYDGGSAMTGGLELTPIPELALRGGVRYWLQPETRAVPALGLGIQYNGCFLDYGMQLEGDEALGLVQRVSLGVRR